MRFKGKVVLVTGVGDNIGAAISWAFGIEEAAVAIDDIDRDAAEEMADKIQAASHMVKEIRPQLGHIHILVNN